MLRDTFLKRFGELEAEFDQLPFEPREGYKNTIVRNGYWRKWATSAQSLIAASFGDTSHHIRNFTALYEKCDGIDYEVRALQAVFLSAKSDFEGGYVFNVEMKVSAEVFGDFITLARQSLSEGHKDVAAVLACAALEDSLKRFASTKGVETTNKTLSDIVNALKAGGHVAGAQKSLLEAMPRIRNAALHAEWAKVSEPEVGSVIAFVEQFLLTKFGDA
jgi:hypothetical protein